MVDIDVTSIHPLFKPRTTTTTVKLDISARLRIYSTRNDFHKEGKSCTTKVSGISFRCSI